MRMSSGDWGRNGRSGGTQAVAELLVPAIRSASVVLHARKMCRTKLLCRLYDCVSVRYHRYRSKAIFVKSLLLSCYHLCCLVSPVWK